MPVQLIRAADLYSGVPYASVAAVPASEFVFAAGACPLDQAGAIVAPGDVQGQARQAVANLASVLKAAGASLTDVLKTTIYVASGDRDDLVAAWDAIRAEFGEHDAPSTLLGVAVLGYPGQLVEIEAVAAAMPGAELQA